MAEMKHLVVTVHGIRTYGNWQDELKNLLQEADPNVTVLSYRYGFFSSLAFLVPPMRWLVARRFRNFFTQVARSAPEGTRIDLVAHSFGTYLAASALPYVPKGRKIHTVILAGSVLRPTFPWYRYRQADTVGRVINECGWDDSVLLLCQSVALLMGMAGRVGFHGMLGEGFVNRYYRFGHGGYFERPGFVAQQWLPLLTGDERIVPHDERPPLTHAGGLKLFFLNNLQFFKVAVACVVLMLMVFLPLDWWRTRQDQRNIERINRIARLANAQDIPGRDPRHVRDLLEVDAKASHNEGAIDNWIPTQGSDDARADEKDDAAEEGGWLARLSQLAGWSRVADQARLEHAKANRQLVAGKAGGPRNLDKARAHFEQAIRGYEQVSQGDPAYGSYALCLVDYGLLLVERGEHERAVKQFRKVREEIFSGDPKAAALGGPPLIPPSVAVETLVLENESLKKLQRWDEATARLEEAIRLAKAQKDDALLTDAYNPSAWLNLERLEVARAVSDLNAAEASCKKPVDNDRFIYRTRLFHIRHGLALTERLQGRADEAYDRYQQIVGDLQKELGNNLKFNPKERGDLRTRLINSAERRADVYLFAWPWRNRGKGLAEAAPETSLAKQSKLSPEEMADRLEDDYQEALDLIANEDLTIRTRLLLKKVIARFLTEVDLRRPMATELSKGRKRRPPGPIDLEFAEARRTLDTLSPPLRQSLSLYHDVAAACMALRAKADEPAVEGSKDQTRFAAQAVAKLRDLTVAGAAKSESEQWDRERVEMLLLALEILVRPEVEKDRDKLAADATRMMAVLGAWTKVGSHPELSGYFTRYQSIASPFTSPEVRMLAGDDDPRRDTTMPPARPAEEMLFYLRLAPGVALKLVADPALAAPASRQAGPLLTADPIHPRTDAPPNANKSAVRH